MADSVSIDPEVLRGAAGRLDLLYNDAGATLRATDQAIANSRDGWKEASSSAFTRFTTYLDTRRTTLQQNLAELSESLTTTANTLQSQDQSRATTTNQLTQSSLNL
ncbi:WXG100 family type VII secretion target [Nocardia brasiliensis]|uniref:WXG100 family type VII secretion target n=1 Tax=Nocardia brasiliensis TaxID=37326 RepID=UPI00366C817A